jgi:hypothetical protein
MRYSSALVAALAAGASATAPMQERADKLFTLEFGPGDVRVVTEDEKFKLRDVRTTTTHATFWAART